MSTIKPLVLFDVDGTLLLTGGVAFQTMKRVASDLFGEGFRWDGIAVAGGLDPLIFAEAARLNQLGDDPRHHESFRARYLEELPGALYQGRERVRTLPGISALLGTLRERNGATLGLLTGNYAGAIPTKFRAAGIDPAWFPITAFGDEASTRTQLARLALEKYGRLVARAVEPRRVLVVGDTPRDVECAQANGCRCFAVATGSFDLTSLRAAGADWVAENLLDPTPLYEAIAVAERS